MSPTPSCNSLIISKLCNEALSTVVPSISTGSKIATGLINPVREVFHSISKSLVSTASSFHLKAIECNGNLDVAPRLLP